MRRLTWTWTCALSLACAVAPTSNETSSTSGSDDSGTSTSTSTSDGETGAPTCYPNVCTVQCGLDECGHDYEGACADDGTCICQPTVNCLPCEDCPPYEGCYGDYTIDGACQFDCYHEFPPFVWEGNCTIQLPSDLPDYIATFASTFFLTIDGMEMPRGDNCDDPQAQFLWWMDADVTTITLCSEMCTQFEQVGSLVAGWGFPCE